MTQSYTCPSALTFGCSDSTAFIEGAIKRSCLQHQRCLSKKRALIKQYPNLK